MTTTSIPPSTSKQPATKYQQTNKRTINLNKFHLLNPQQPTLDFYLFYFNNKLKNHWNNHYKTEGTFKSAKKQHCPVMRDESMMNSLLPPTCLTTASTTTITSNNRYIHQTSDCLPINYDQYNPNQTPSSLISNINSSSKSNKNRKLSSSTAVNSHHYNNHLFNNTNNNSNSNLFNGDTYSHEIWGGGGAGGGGGAVENFNVRSRTSSPTHGSSGNNYHKYER